MYSHTFASSWSAAHYVFAVIFTLVRSRTLYTVWSIERPWLDRLRLNGCCHLRVGARRKKQRCISVDATS